MNLISEMEFIKFDSMQPQFPVYYNSTIDRNECECCEFLEIAEIIAALIQANSNSIQNEVRNKLLTSAIDY